MNHTLIEKPNPLEEQVAQEEKIIGKPQLLFLCIIVGLIAADQLSKLWVSYELNMYQPVIVFGDYLRLVLVHNTGLIWSIPIKSTISYYILPIIGIIFVLYLGLRTESKCSAIAYGFIISGAIGNLIDRIRLGYVVDFIDMGVKNTRWATYNIADAAIVIGLCLIIGREIFNPKKHPKPQE